MIDLGRAVHLRSITIGGLAALALALPQQAQAVNSASASIREIDLDGFATVSY